MKKDLFHRTVDTIISRGEARGEAIGEARGQARIINSLLDYGYDLEDICVMSSLEKNHVLNLLK